MESDSNQFESIDFTSQDADSFEEVPMCCKEGKCSKECNCVDNKEEEKLKSSQPKEKTDKEKTVIFNNFYQKKANSFPKRVDKRRGNIKGIGRRG